MTKQQYLKQWLKKPDFPDYDLGDLTAFAVQSRYPDELSETVRKARRRNRERYAAPYGPVAG